MNDNSVPVSRVIMAALWAWVVVLVCVAWGLVVAGHWQLAFMCGLTACASSAAAAVAHIRCFTLRICALVRANREIHPIR